jgi:hypothetical protein
MPIIASPTATAAAAEVLVRPQPVQLTQRDLDFLYHLLHARGLLYSLGSERFQILARNHQVSEAKLLRAARAARSQPTDKPEHSTSQPLLQSTPPAHPSPRSDLCLVLLILFSAPAFARYVNHLASTDKAVRPYGEIIALHRAAAVLLSDTSSFLSFLSPPFRYTKHLIKLALQRIKAGPNNKLTPGLCAILVDETRSLSTCTIHGNLYA